MNQIKNFTNQRRDIAQDKGYFSSKIFLWVVWITYVGYLLLSDLPPGESVLHPQPETLKEAIDLSLNFWFVLPALFPNVAPVLHPMLEGLFNITIVWGLLFWGFLIDGRQQRLPFIPFLIGTALLTNVFYLPWLALRQPNPDPPEAVSPLEKLAESRALPLILATVALASIAWAAWARPEFGDLPHRWQALRQLLESDRLAYSFLVDLLVFWLFQAWLVTDDMVRRQWHDAKALWIARLVPFVGLVIYLLRRPALLISGK
ncbi:hypothetical protein IFO70_10545 [Phormidium tenue FACHB-886]|nr:hypothetical protein [Phormidium tenue FACHB-886]